MPQREYELDFVEQVERWLEEEGEVFVVIVEPNGRETVYYAICSSIEQLTTAIAGLRPTSEIVVIKEKQLPMRGLADDAFLQRALAMVDEPEDFLILSLEGDKLLERDAFHGDRRGELEAMFDDFVGQRVAFGKLPHWFEPEAVESLQARIPAPPLREIRVELVELPAGEKAVDEDTEHGARTKLGGEPTWIHNDEMPICPFCDNKMIFVAQIDSLDQLRTAGFARYRANGDEETASYMFGDVGLIYVFFCFECNETNSIFQCY
jgi:hypothetical protein